jgi:hypothetical protein
MVLEHQLVRMGVEIDLLLQIGFVVETDVVGDQGDRDDQREKALVVESDHFAKFLLLVRCQPFLDATNNRILKFEPKSFCWTLLIVET